MKNNKIVWTFMLLILNSLTCASTGSTEHGAELHFFLNKAKNDTEMLTGNINRIDYDTETWKPGQEQKSKVTETNFKNLIFTENMENCIEDRQYEITSNYKKGKEIIMSCAKEAVITNLMQYLRVSQNFSISFFNGLFEFAKIPDPLCNSSADNFNSLNNCDWDFTKNNDLEKNGWAHRKREYLKSYRGKNDNERTYRGKLENKISDEEQLRRIKTQENRFLSEIIKSFTDNYWEKKEVDELKNEINDSKLLDTLNALTRNYMLKINYLPGATAKIRRGNNNKIIFDLDLEENDTSETEDVEVTNAVEGNWRQSRFDFFSDSEESENSQRPNKKYKNKKASRKQQKKVKKIKKQLSFLAFPMMIQLAILPFVLKKLFFLAMGALTAGKLALILVVYRLLLNLKVNNEDDYVRLEHYGYKEGEEYGAWVNGRSFPRSLIDSLSEAPFKGRNTVEMR